MKALEKKEIKEEVEKYSGEAEKGIDPMDEPKPKMVSYNNLYIEGDFYEFENILNRSC